MSEFVIVNGLPYLLSHGKTLAVRWDEKGFHIGAEVKLASVPDVTYSELSIKAKCAVLDSITVEEPEEEQEESADVQTDGEQQEPEEEQEESAEFEKMTVKKLKDIAEANNILLSSAKTKAEIIEKITAAEK